MSLAGLGLTAAEEQVYRFLLTTPGRDPSTLDLDTAVIRPAMDRLIALGLATVDDAGVLVAAPPEASIELLAQRRIERIIADLQEVARAREALPAIMAGADQEAAASPAQFERLLGKRRVMDRIEQEWNLDPASEVRAARIGPRFSTYPQNDRLHRNTLFNLRRGVRYRTLIHASTLDDPQYLAYARDLHQAGDIHRVTNDPIQVMVMYDRTRAYVPIEAGNAEAGALRIQEPGTVAALVDLYDAVWERSTDLELALAEKATTRDREVLHALLENATDEAAARQLGVSVRTFRRHVAHLMNRLNADSRFQLASIAREKGWL